MDRLRSVVADSISPRLSDDDFEKTFADWEYVPYGDLMGVALIKGTELHFVPSPTFKVDRKLLRQQIQPLLERQGFLTTRVQHADKQSQRMNKLFGFKPTWADEQFQYSIMTALPFKE